MKKVRWGVLGTGWISGAQTIPGMKAAEHCELYAIAGRSEEKVNAFMAEFGFPKGYAGYDLLLADPDVDAVYIALPNDLHEEWTERCLDAGKHVLCEKPFVPTRNQAERLFAKAREKKLHLMEAFAYLHSPLIGAIRRELDAGTIGSVRFMESAFISTAASPDNFRSRREQFGGSLYDIGCYPISAILWMLGTNPREVHACAGFTPAGVDAYCSGLLVYENDVRASFTCGYVLPTDVNGDFMRIDRLRIVGTKGSIDTAAQFNQCGNVSYTITSGDTAVTKTIRVPQNYQLEVEQFSRCVMGREPAHVDAEFSLSLAGVLDEVLRQIGY